LLLTNNFKLLCVNHVPGLYHFNMVSAALQGHFLKTILNMAEQQLNGSVHVKRNLKKEREFKRKVENMMDYDERIQQVAHVSMSKEEYRAYRDFLKSNFKPQALGCDIKHTVTWQAGDRLINTVSDGISRLTGSNSGSNSSIPSNNPSIDVGRNAASLPRGNSSSILYDGENPDGSEPSSGDSPSGSTFIQAPFSWGPPIRVEGMNDSFFESLLKIFGSTEFVTVIGSINFMAFGLQRRKINLIAGMACLTTVLIKELSKPVIDDIITRDLLMHHQRMSEWLDEVSSDEVDNPDVEMEEIPVPQGFSDASDYLVEAIVAFVSLGLGIKAKSPFFHTISNMMRVTDKTKENMASVLLNISGRFCEFFTTTCKNETLATFFEVDLITSEDVKVLLNRAQDYIAECNAGTALCQGFREEIYVTLSDDIMSTLKKLDSRSYDHKILSNAHNEMLKLNTLQRSFSKALGGDRIEPVGILIYGAPGTFKTILDERIKRLVARYTLPLAWRADFDANPNEFLYTLPNDKFFDGYTYRAWVCSIDDAFQRREQAGDQDPESLKVIKMINTAPYLLPMAQADAKNTKYFRAPFVMATTNLPDFSMLQAITDHTAVERRFNIRLDVTINKKYTNKKGKLNYDKIPFMELVTEENIHINSTFIPEDFWDITLTEHVAGRKLASVSMTFDDVIRKIISSHKDKIKNFYINRETTEQTFQNLVSRLDDEFLLPVNVVPRWNIQMGSVAVPQSMGRGASDMEIRSVSDGDGGRVYVPIRRGYVDNYSNVRRDDISPDDSISLVPPRHIPDVRIRHQFGPHDPGDAELVSGSIPGSFTRTQSFDRTNNNPILDYIFNNHPDMYNSFTAMILAFCHRNGYTILFDNNLVCLNMHLTAISAESLAYILDGLNHGYFIDRLKLSLQKCDEEGLDYFTMEPKFWKGIVVAKRILKKVAKFGSEVFSFLKKHFVSILFCGGMIGAAGFFFWKLYRKIIGAAGVDNEPQSIDQSRVAARGYARRVGKPNKLSNFVKVAYVAQGMIIDTFEVEKLPKLVSSDFGNRNGTSDIMAKVLNKYLFIAYIFYREKETGATGYVRLGHMANIVGNVFAHPFHYVFDVQDFMQKPTRDSFQMVLVTTNKSICYRFPISDFFENFHTTDAGADNDRCLFVCKHAQNTSAGMLKYLINAGDLRSINKLTRVKLCLLGSYNNIEGKHLSLRMKDVSGKVMMEPNYVQATWTGQMNDYYSIENSVEYDADLSNGDCGSLLFVKEGNFQNRVIMGMHIAGDSKKGFSTMLVYEDMLNLVNDCELDVLAFTAETEPDFIDYTPINNPQGGLQSSGVIHKDEAPSAATHSNIEKSKLHGKLPFPYNKITTIPAKLHKFQNDDGEWLDPAEISLKAYKRSPGCIPYEYIENAAFSYEQQIRNASASYKHPRDVIGIREALHHFRDVKPIASSTSPGHPMNVPKYLNLKKLYYKSLELGKDEEAEGYLMHSYRS